MACIRSVQSIISGLWCVDVAMHECPLTWRCRAVHELTAKNEYAYRCGGGGGGGDGSGGIRKGNVVV